MASSKSYLQFILDQLSELDGVSYRAMMGEFILYYRGRIIGGVYDDRLLVKPVKAALEYVSAPVFALPYKGANPMLLIEDADSRKFLTGLFEAMYDELPEPAKKRSSK